MPIDEHEHVVDIESEEVKREIAEARRLYHWQKDLSEKEISRYAEYSRKEKQTFGKSEGFYFSP